MKRFFLFLLIWSSGTLYAQREASNWYFGNKAGIRFINGKPEALTDGILNTTEGCATISDKNGNLLFYTDGKTVWNKNHQIMASGLEGHDSATQSGVIVPKPNSNNIFYIFTVHIVEPPKGLQYTIVDMNVNNGLGEVKEKNIPVLSPTDEKVTAVRHKNNKDVWIITHKWNSDEYYSYLLTKEGLSKTPVISKIGLMHTSNADYSIGYLKASPKGNKLAAAIKSLAKYELFDFDNTTGKLSNFIELEASDSKALTYGIEFSSDGSKLYCSAGSINEIYQFDLKEQTPELIRKSRFLVGKTTGWTGALQLGSDGIIYVSPYAVEHLGVIRNPNKKGSACNFEEKAIYLKGAKTQLGLPTFMQTYFEETENLLKITTKDNKPVILGEAFTKDILFDFDKFAIKPEYFKELDDLAEYMKAVDNVNIDIVGHTDNEGTDQKNMLLSQNRAKALRDYLVKKGIAPQRISHKGLGETTPVAPNTTPEGRALNRRIEFTLKKI
ncbi:MAG: OmpA family protein [Raineya sp.]|jgi:outer membrane protein OmpA-like peptidoglycan-associated protein|nr:OmpA family protein [Raineya sp.]